MTWNTLQLLLNILHKDMRKKMKTCSSKREPMGTFKTEVYNIIYGMAHGRKKCKKTLTRIYLHNDFNSLSCLHLHSELLAWSFHEI